MTEPAPRKPLRCSQDVSPQPWSTEVVWAFNLDREPPYRSVDITCYADGSAPCDRCGLRHPWDQMFHRDGLVPAHHVPMGWGETQAARDADDAPADAGRFWSVEW